MKAASKLNPLHRSDDPDKIRREIAKIEATGLKVIRPTVFQIKVGLVNYYPNTGRISIDGMAAQPDRGVDRFIQLIEEANAQEP